MRKLMTTLKCRNRQPQARQFAAVASLALSTVLTTAALPAAAQAPQCAPREAVLERLSSDYREEPVSIGVTATGSLLEVLASPEGSWTIIITVPGGPTCLVSSRKGWRGAPVQDRKRVWWGKRGA